MKCIILAEIEALIRSCTAIRSTVSIESPSRRDKVELAVQTTVSIPFIAISIVGRDFKSPTTSEAPSARSSLAVGVESSRMKAATFLCDANKPFVTELPSAPVLPTMRIIFLLPQGRALDLDSWLVSISSSRPSSAPTSCYCSPALLWEQPSATLTCSPSVLAIGKPQRRSQKRAGYATASERLRLGKMRTVRRGRQFPVLVLGGHMTRCARELRGSHSPSLKVGSTGRITSVTGASPKQLCRWPTTGVFLTQVTSPAPTEEGQAHNTLSPANPFDTARRACGCFQPNAAADLNPEQPNRDAWRHSHYPAAAVRYRRTFRRAALELA